MRLEKSIVINQPIDTVFAFITDIHKVKLWLPVKDARPLSDGPGGVGSRFLQSGEFMGQQFEGVTEVTAYEPPRVFAFQLVDGPFPLQTRITCAPTGSATRLTLLFEGEPGGALKVAGPLLQMMIKKQLNTQLDTLKRLLESPGQR